MGRRAHSTVVGRSLEEGRGCQVGRRVSVQVSPAASVTRTTTAWVAPVPDCSSSAWPRSPAHRTADVLVWAHVQLELRTESVPAPDALLMRTVIEPPTWERTRTEIRAGSRPDTRRTVMVGATPPGWGAGGVVVGAGGVELGDGGLVVGGAGVAGVAPPLSADVPPRGTGVPPTVEGVLPGSGATSPDDGDVRVAADGMGEALMVRVGRPVGEIGSEVTTARGEAPGTAPAPVPARAPGAALEAVALGTGEAVAEGAASEAPGSASAPATPAETASPATRPVTRLATWATASTPDPADEEEEGDGAGGAGAPAPGAGPPAPPANPAKPAAPAPPERPTTAGRLRNPGVPRPASSASGTMSAGKPSWMTRRSAAMAAAWGHSATCASARSVCRLGRRPRTSAPRWLTVQWHSSVSAAARPRSARASR